MYKLNPGHCTCTCVLILRHYAHQQEFKLGRARSAPVHLAKHGVHARDGRAVRRPGAGVGGEQHIHRALLHDLAAAALRHMAFATQPCTQAP